jgi:hypothetical protein
MSVQHIQGDGEAAHIVHDVLRSYRATRGEPLNLSGVIADIVAIARRYRVYDVTGDAYAAGWVTQAFERAGFPYQHAPLDRSAAYLEAEPFLTQGRVALLESEPLFRELTQLERRPRPGGRDRIDHPSGGYDDLANVTCLGIALLGLELGHAPFVFRCGGQTISSELTPMVVSQLQPEAGLRAEGTGTLRHFRDTSEASQ